MKQWDWQKCTHSTETKLQFNSLKSLAVKVDKKFVEKLEVKLARVAAFSSPARPRCSQSAAAQVTLIPNPRSSSFGHFFSLEV